MPSGNEARFPDLGNECRRRGLRISVGLELGFPRGVVRIQGSSGVPAPSTSIGVVIQALWQSIRDICCHVWKISLVRAGRLLALSLLLQERGRMSAPSLARELEASGPNDIARHRIAQRGRRPGLFRSRERRGVVRTLGRVHDRVGETRGVGCAWPGASPRRGARVQRGSSHRDTRWSAAPHPSPAQLAASAWPGRVGRGHAAGRLPRRCSPRDAQSRS